MGKAATNEATEDTSVHKIGDHVVFAGYTALDEGQDEILTKGETVEITEVTAPGQYSVSPVDRESDPDTVFDEELESLTVENTETATQAEAHTEPEPEAKPKTKAKTKKTTTSKTKKKTTTTTAPKRTATATPKTTATRGLANAEGTVVADSESVAEELADKDAKEAAIELVNRVEKTYYTLGGVLRHVDLEGLHKQDGPEYEGKDGFQRWCEDKLGLRYRKARYLITIYEKFATLGVDESRLAEIGWSKAKELCNIPDADLESDFDSLVQTAKDRTREELVDHIKRQYVSAGGATGTRNSRVQKTVMRFTLFGGDGEMVTRAIEHAKTQVEEPTEDEALAHISARYLENAGVEVSLEEAIADISRRFGYEVSVVDDTDETETDTQSTD